MSVVIASGQCPRMYVKQYSDKDGTTWTTNVVRALCGSEAQMIEIMKKVSEANEPGIGEMLLVEGPETKRPLNASDLAIFSKAWFKSNVYENAGAKQCTVVGTCGIYIGTDNIGKTVTGWLELRDTYKMSLDDGKTWQACEVEDK